MPGDVFLAKIFPINNTTTSHHLESYHGIKAA